MVRYNIKEFREEKGYSIQKLADKVGISRTYMSQIENGNVDNIGTKLLVSIAQCLDKTVDDLLILS